MSQVTEKAVLDALRMVEDPDLRKDIVSLGFVKDLAIKGGDVRFTIELTTPACPVKDMMKNAAINAVSEIPGVTSVDVNMTAQVRGPQSGGAPAGPGHLPGIAHIVPVASGKGGVGKSTVSANLAVALAAQGARVGLMDADIYGPSIPAIMTSGMASARATIAAWLPTEPSSSTTPRSSSSSSSESSCLTRSQT